MLALDATQYIYICIASAAAVHVEGVATLFHVTR